MVVRTTSVAARLAALAIAGLSLTGCFGGLESEEPNVATIQEERLILASLPDVPLVRRVDLTMSPEEMRVGTKDQPIKGVSSKFGEAGEVADLSCVIDGLRRALPRSEIVPAERFWATVVGEGEEVRLPALFEPPLAARWHDLDVAFLVAAYHRELDTSEGLFSYVLASGYSHSSHQVAAEVTVDVPNQTALGATRAKADELGIYGHVLVYPVIASESAASEPCELMGERSGAVILANSASVSPRVLILAAGRNPYNAAKAASSE